MQLDCDHDPQSDPVVFTVAPLVRHVGHRASLDSSLAPLCYDGWGRINLSSQQMEGRMATGEIIIIPPPPSIVTTVTTSKNSGRKNLITVAGFSCV